LDLWFWDRRAAVSFFAVCSISAPFLGATSLAKQHSSAQNSLLICCRLLISFLSVPSWPSSLSPSLSQSPQKSQSIKGSWNVGLRVPRCPPYVLDMAGNQPWTTQQERPAGVCEAVGSFPRRVMLPRARVSLGCFSVSRKNSGAISFQDVPLKSPHSIPKQNSHSSGTDTTTMQDRKVTRSCWGDTTSWGARVNEEGKGGLTWWMCFLYKVWTWNTNTCWNHLKKGNGVEEELLRRWSKPGQNTWIHGSVTVKSLYSYQILIKWILKITSLQNQVERGKWVED
jgi:hypothetical protein